MLAVETTSIGIHPAPHVSLLDGPSVTQGGLRIAVPEGSKRLVAFLALHSGPVDRMFVACSLWPDGSDERASGNLRTALWRLRGAGITVVESEAHSVRLSEDAVVDVAVLCAWADRVILGSSSPPDLAVPPQLVTAVDLLPGWYEDWVAFEREAIRQRMLHALESLAAGLAGYGRPADAIEAAMAAVRIEPLRESAHRTLASVHLEEGNVFEAVRVFRDYRGRVRRELGAEPSARFADLLRPHVAGRVLAAN
ncbi:BTAD domain-containing putative transcriptional regulator [Microbacterium sp. 10M-3C3]|jgi:DNA-binding SARP family transcriptional activator|uniref:AfsR/SARP family transcriptional regulator n=1 Tax=Microbacterium sp. 10M-3C3 TaxID=2483401 RepID=UPI000F6425C3|nr:BTAD domain-containing putative transcriptional regulator [Microbacterium sp. 10M-3C3]